MLHAASGHCRITATHDGTVGGLLPQPTTNGHIVRLLWEGRQWEGQSGNAEDWWNAWAGMGMARRWKRGEGGISVALLCAKIITLLFPPFSLLYLTFLDSVPAK